jgi:hypothetical protein
MTSVAIPFLTPPADIVNRAIDSLGQSGKVIGDLTDGTMVSEAARRNYGPVLRQLLAAAHWGFARKQATLTLLGDITGASALPVITTVESPWTYAYAWPIDGVAGRWLPAGYPAGSGQLPPQGAQLPGGLMTPLIPARFLVSSSNLYPVEVGQVPWIQQPDLARTQGVGPVNRKVILTDIPPPAQFVYTRLVTVIEEWDDLFSQAMVALMAVILAPTAIEDPKLRVVERDKAVAMARNMIADARVASANESGFPMSVDHTPAWISGRNRGWWGGVGGDSGAGTYGLGWESFGCGGSVF